MYVLVVCLFLLVVFTKYVTICQNEMETACCRPFHSIWPVDGAVCAIFFYCIALANRLLNIQHAINYFNQSLDYLIVLAKVERKKRRIIINKHRLMAIIDR